jgi:MFS family permease
MVATPGAAATPDWPNPRYGWFVVSLLVLAYAFGVVDRIVIGLLTQSIKADLGLSDTELGLIQGLAFSLFFAVAALPVGMLIDRWRRVPVLWLGLLLTSGATVACGFAGGFLSLFIARMFIGAGSSVTNPGSSSIIADYFPPTLRPRAYGIFNMGGSIGIGFAYLLGSVAITLAGTLQGAAPALLGGFGKWQIVLFVVGAPGLLIALVMAMAMREPARRGSVPTTARISLLPLWREMQTNRRALLAIMLGAIFNVMIVNAQLAWFPTLFFRIHQWTPARVGTALALVGVPFGLLSAITAGWALSALARRGRDDGPLLVMGLQCASWAIFGPLKCFAPTPGLALAGHVATSLFATWAITSALTALNQITPNQLRGQVVAVYTILFGFAGVAIGSVAVGLLNDYVFTDVRGIAPSLALVNAVGGVAGMTLLIWGRKAYLASVQRSRGFGDSQT